MYTDIGFLAINRIGGIDMTQGKFGNRVVVIAGTATTSGNTDQGKTTEQRPNARRIVVIRNGELVGSRPGR
jgi:hypothetical protein